MSQRNPARPRASSLKPPKVLTTFPEEYVSPVSATKPQIISAIRIEERLLNQQTTYKKRLEVLKQNIEKEQLRELQAKPKISSKSRILASKAEKRMLQQYIDSKEPAIKTKTSYAELEVSYSARSLSQAKSPGPVTHQRPTKKRTKSLVNLITLTDQWVEEKKSSLGIIKKVKEERKAERLKKETPAPKPRRMRSMRDSSGSNISFITSPQSAKNSVNSRKALEKQPYRPIAPFQIKVSFNCGIDLDSFLRRAK